MTTLSIIGYEKNTVCAHCGRKLVHAIVTPELGEIGAQCFSSLIKPKKTMSAPNGYKPDASTVRDYAKMVEFNGHAPFIYELA